MADEKSYVPHALLKDIEAERAYQIEKRGWTPEFDDKNTLNDWVCYMTQYQGNACFAKTPQEQRAQLLKAITLGIAALEAFDRRGGSFAPRHYDPTPGPGRSPREV